MTYPLNEEEFVERWVSVLDGLEDGDRELATAIARTINRAYAAGVKVGRKEKTKECTQTYQKS